MKSIYLRIFLGLFVFALFVSSCDRDKSKVIEFAEQFSSALANKDTAAIIKMYPDAIKADSVCFTYVPDSISIEKKDNTMKVKFGNNREVVMKESDDKKLSIISSKGIIYYDPMLINFAKKVGWIEDGFTDNLLLDRFSDTLFLDYLKFKTVEQLRSNVYIDKISNNREEFCSDGTAPSDWFITVVNNLNKDVIGEIYEIEIISHVRNNLVKKLKGEDIFSGASVQLQTHLESFWYFSIENGDLEDPAFELHFKVDNLKIVSKYYQPRGNEYKEFKN
ncbi:MAG: hypothetical protein IKZ62_00025 [Prevotella sp.]|nr:hypothetical protein [Prevotella sp.]